MHTLSKQQVSNWVLLDYSAQKQVLIEKIAFFKKNTLLILNYLNNKLSKQPSKILKLGTTTSNGKPTASFCPNC